MEKKKLSPPPLPQPRHDSLPDSWGSLVCVSARVFVLCPILPQYFHTQGDQLCVVLHLQLLNSSRNFIALEIMCACSVAQSCLTLCDPTGL